MCNNILHAGVNHSFENTGINLATAQKPSTLSPRADARRVKMKTAVSDNHVLMYHRINLAAIADHSNVCSVIAPLCSTVQRGGEKFTSLPPPGSLQLFDPIIRLAFVRLYSYINTFGSSLDFKRNTFGMG